MAEETGNAKVHASRGILYTIGATGIGGVALILGFLFAVDNLPAIDNDDYNSGGPNTGNSGVNLFILGCGENIGACLAWIVTINLFFAGLSSVAVTARITFALARDGGFPWSRHLSSLHPVYKTPLWALTFIAVVDSLLLLLPLDKGNGSIVYTAIVGSSVLGFQVSYLMPILLKNLFPQPDFPETEMSLGTWSRMVGVVSSVWLGFTTVLLFMPTEFPVTVANMNWLFLITLIICTFGGLNWFVSARYHFKGPPKHEDFQRMTGAEEDCGSVAPIKSLTNLSV